MQALVWMGRGSISNEPGGLGVCKAVVLKQGISSPPRPPGGGTFGNVWGCFWLS